MHDNACVDFLGISLEVNPVFVLLCGAACVTQGCQPYNPRVLGLVVCLVLSCSAGLSVGWGVAAEAEGFSTLGWVFSIVLGAVALWILSLQHYHRRSSRAGRVP